MLDGWDRKEKLILAQICLTGFAVLITVASIIVGVCSVIRQMEHGTAAVSRAALEAALTEFSKMEITDQTVSCLYHYDIKTVDEQCTELLRKPTNLRKTLNYTHEVLGFLAEVKAFSEKYDTQYMNGFNDWIEEISKSDAVLFYLCENKIKAEEALRDYGLKTMDTTIRDGHLRFKKKIGLKQ
jgi:hypothetical protein